MKTITITTLALTVGVALGFTANQFLPVGQSAALSASTASSSTNEPLYWVAPMDPNYRRDKPGKSPMGMDLIPVYAEDQANNTQAAGTVTISPSVENNLGVKREAVKKAYLAPRIETVGYIAFDESRLWQTNVRVAGWVEKLHINAVGEKVQQGDVLFTFYSPDLVKAQEELLNAYRTSRSGLIKGATERLVSLGVDREQIRQIVKSGKAQQTIAIKAAADGIIASLNIREGGYLSPAQTVISAGPLDDVWVDAEVFERQAHWITSGSPATMSLDSLPGQSWQGEVDYVYPILDPQTRTLRMRLKFPNPDGELKPNMFAGITLQPKSQQSVLTVPRSAVIHAGGMSRVVLAEGDGQYRSVRIETGREADDRVEVLKGLEDDDIVVTSAHFMLDSESSQSADLSRIDSGNDADALNHTAWAKGEITDVMADHRMLTIRHQPVPQWDWPGMTMNFQVNEQVDLSTLGRGQAIEFEMAKTDAGQFEVINVKADHSVLAAEVWVTGDITMLMADFGMLTLKHQPVHEWQWDAGVMNFSVADDIDLSAFKEGETVRFLIARSGSDYTLVDIEPAIQGGK